MFQRIHYAIIPDRCLAEHHDERNRSKSMDTRTAFRGLTFHKSGFVHISSTPDRLKRSFGVG
jgi:hypothetical protein